MNPFGTYRLGPFESFGVLLARHAFRGQGSARRLIEKLFIGKRAVPIDAPIWGGSAKLRLPGTSSAKYLISDRRYNSREREFLRRVMRPGDVIADVGANIGFYTLWLAAAPVPGTRVIAFEPNPSVYNALEENVRLNGFDHVTTVQAAVGEANKMVSLGIVPDAPGISSLLNTKAEQVEVRMVTLADALKDAGLNRCDIIKIDVEGYEYEALIPYFEATSKDAWPRALLIEKNRESRNWRGSLIHYLEDRGYHVALKTRGNVVLMRGENAA